MSRFLPAFVVLIGQVIKILVLPNQHEVGPIARSFDQGSEKIAQAGDNGVFAHVYQGGNYPPPP